MPPTTSPNGGGGVLMRGAVHPVPQVRTVLSASGHFVSKIVKPSVSAAASRQLQSRVAAAGTVEGLRNLVRSSSSLSASLQQQLQLSRDAAQQYQQQQPQQQPQQQQPAQQEQQQSLLAPAAIGATRDQLALSEDDVYSADFATANDFPASAAESYHQEQQQQHQQQQPASASPSAFSTLSSSSSSSSAAAMHPFFLMTPLPADFDAAEAPSDLLPAGFVNLPSLHPSAPPPHVAQASKILANMLETQHAYLPVPNFLRRIQKDEIQEFMRRDILEWLMRVARHFDHHAETFGTAVNLFDRFLSTLKVKPTHLQLIAATALLIAAKSQEQWNTHPTLGSLIQASNAAFACVDILRMERIILARLKWQLASVTPHLLVHQIVPCMEQTLQLASPQHAYRLIADAEAYCDAALIEYRYANVLPSTIACGALCCALARTTHLMQNKDVLQQLLALSGTDYDTAVACYSDMKLLLAEEAPLM